ncbi:MAG TPA: hypothetical protein VMV86_03365 [Methanosarcinales archaeon]|nr:hypothetical protein [Methanosarcinales archaeon]
MKIGQAVLVRKPDNEAKEGQQKKRDLKDGLSKGVICEIYKHHMLVQFKNYKSSYRIADIMLGLEPYKEITGRQIEQETEGKPQPIFYESPGESIYTGRG